jgi:hypothetical protein
VPRVRSFFVAAGVVLAAAGCGGASHYTLEATRKCLQDAQGVVLRGPPANDFIAKVATRGAMNVRFPDNQVTITFSEDSDQADNVAKGYRRFRGKGIGIDSALEQVANVVMVWGITPVQAERDLIHGCLKG